MGQYLAPDETAQMSRPREVIDLLLSKILTIRSYLIAIAAIVSLVTMLTLVLVMVLSIRLRPVLNSSRCHKLVALKTRLDISLEANS